jgi:dienelactone hydrolase
MKTIALATWGIFAAFLLNAAAPKTPPTPAEQMLARYFEAETAALEAKCLDKVDDWQAKRPEFRRQLQEMLGLEPMPPRSDLKTVVTDKFEHESIVVEKLHFQSMPGLYVTANLYRPKQLDQPAPTILYVCGHGPVISNGISYGNKVAYQHHGIWFARNGYICLLIDTLQLGEIQGLHHGTYRDNMWWWNSRGYTPAGIEAWNSIRALDYLATRTDVDTNRFGVTGRSGGGAYSWWTAALDDRIKVTAPVAGITDLRNHVVDGAVEGHCDCMFTVNTYRWDYPQVAALIAPRPLIIANSDNDRIFPLDGVVRLHAKVKKVYEALNAATNLALLITPGPHKDTQDLQLPVFRFFNRYLKREDPLIETAAVKLFKPEQLKVFASLPSDAINKTVHETFRPNITSTSRPASLTNPPSPNWSSKMFAGWPQRSPLAPRIRFSVERDGLVFRGIDFISQANVPLRLYVFGATDGAKPSRMVLNILGETPAGAKRPASRPEAVLSWAELLALMNAEFPDYIGEERSVSTTNSVSEKTDIYALKKWLYANHAVAACVAPRGIGLSAWNSNERAQTHLRRRFMLLGQTVDSMRVWDIRRAVQAMRSLLSTNAPLSICAEGSMAVDALYASLFEPVTGLEFWNLPASDLDRPDYLNVQRVLPMEQALLLALKDRPIQLHGTKSGDWTSVVQAADQLGWHSRLSFVE